MKKSITTLCMILFSVVLFAQNKPCNCCTEKHAEFDFWIGTWEVTNPDGT